MIQPLTNFFIIVPLMLIICTIADFIGHWFILFSVLLALAFMWHPELIIGLIGLIIELIHSFTTR